MSGTATIDPPASPAIEPMLPPGPRSPRFVQMARFLLQPVSFISDCEARYGRYFTIRLPIRDVVVTSDPVAIKAAFTGDPNDLRAGEGNAPLGPILGDRSVLLLDGPEHMRQRKLMLPPFHGDRMRHYGDAMREAAERQIAKWPVGSEFPAEPSMQAIALEVILRAVFGLGSTAEVERVGAPLRRVLDTLANRYWVFALQMTSSENPRSRSPWGRFARFRAAADAVVFEQIAARRADPDHGERDDVLSLLLDARDEDGNGLTDQELRDELMTLLLAGHETTATSLAWTLGLLRRHPDVLERLHEEERDPEDNNTYLDAVITESMRMRPVVPTVARMLRKPLELPDRTIPADVFLSPSIYLLHHRADIYPEPERFNPDRFLGKRPGTYEWIPFGGGVRRCLGASFALYEMKMVLEAVLAHTRLQTTTEPPERIYRRAITFAPSDGGRIAIASRNG